MERKRKKAGGATRGRRGLCEMAGRRRQRCEGREKETA